MKAIILAAGLGSRLGNPIPKALTGLVDGKSILQHQVDALTDFISPEDIMVVTGFKKELIMEAMSGLMFVYNPSFDTTNTAKSLLCGVRKVRREDILWLNGDVVFTPEVVHRVLSAHRSGMAVNTTTVGEEEVKYVVGDDHAISAISKSVENALGEAVGINFIQWQDVRLLERSLAACDDRDYFERGVEIAISHGLRIYPIDISDQFCVEIDFASDLDQVNAFLRRRAIGEAA